MSAETAAVSLKASLAAARRMEIFAAWSTKQDSRRSAIALGSEALELGWSHYPELRFVRT